MRIWHKYKSLRHMQLLGRHGHGCVVDAKGCALTWDVGLDLELVRLLQVRYAKDSNGPQYKNTDVDCIQTEHCRAVLLLPAAVVRTCCLNRCILRTTCCSN